MPKLACFTEKYQYIFPTYKGCPKIRFYLQKKSDHNLERFLSLVPLSLPFLHWAFTRIPHTTLFMSVLTGIVLFGQSQKMTRYRAAQTGSIHSVYEPNHMRTVRFTGINGRNGDPMIISIVAFINCAAEINIYY